MRLAYLLLVLFLPRRGFPRQGLMTIWSCGWRKQVAFHPCTIVSLSSGIDAEEKSTGGIIIPDTAKEKLAFLHAFITHRFMFRRIRFDLRAIQCDVAEFDQPCCLAQLQNL